MVIQTTTEDGIVGEQVGGIQKVEFPTFFYGIREHFLVSFLVDARGGSMCGSRHPGLRILVPLNATSAPTRITCRMLRPERTTTPPQLNDSEGLACRIIELGPYGCRFNSSVLLEIPYFASLSGRQRELVILRSDNAETWREHSLEATDQAVQSALGQSFDGLLSMKELRERRIIRILTNDFPQYLAIVSRMRQESALIGSDGGVLSSTVVPQVQAVFPEGALQKRIRVGLQAQLIPPELVARLSTDGRSAVSPIVTLEPRRRKFHKPITLTIPLPKSQSSNSGNVTSPTGHAMNDHRSQTVSNLRLLCSITGGTNPAHWEDITGSTPLSKVKDCVSFTTTVSARFWLMECQNVHESAEFATRLYDEATSVPYMGKFVVFTKRLDSEEALVRCFCVTDDKVDKTLECQEGFEVCAASPEVEIVDDRAIWLEVGGNLLPVTKVNEQLRLQFNVFRENRLAFPIRLKNPQEEPVGKLVFMREPRTGLRDNDFGGDTSGGTMQKLICTLEIRLGSTHHDSTNQNNVMGNQSLMNGLQSPMVASIDQLNALSSDAQKLSSMHCVFPTRSNEMQSEGGSPTQMDLNDFKSDWTKLYTTEVIARSQIDLVQVANEVGSDWPKLVGVLIPQSRLHSMCTVNQLVQWINESENRWRAMHPEGRGPFGGQLHVNELRTVHDQALAVLLAWCEECGTAVTGNLLDRALRQIGREDVIKTCMSDIRYVVDAQEYNKASRQIDDKVFNMDDDDDDEVDLRTNVSDFNSASLVATDNLLSGMNDSVTLPFDRTENQPPGIYVSPLPDESELIAKSETHTISAHQTKSTEEGLGDDADIDLAAHEQEEDWQSRPEPVRSTSQYGGDPLLFIQKDGTSTAAEECDLIRDSESMNNSSEQIGPTGHTGVANSEKPDTSESSSQKILPEVQLDEFGQTGDAECINQYINQLEADDDDDDGKSNLSAQSDLIIQPSDDLPPNQTSQQRLCDTNSTGDYRQYHNQAPINGLISNDHELVSESFSDHLINAHHGAGDSTTVRTGEQLQAYDEDPASVASVDNCTEFPASHAHHGLGPTDVN